jgi:uncharacterized coiled-coil protein SlyX
MIEVPTQTLNELQAKAVIEMARKISKLEEEVKILTEIIRAMEQKNG